MSENQKNSADIVLHTAKADFDGMYKAGKLAKKVLEHIEQYIKPGVTTEDLNMICHEMIVANNAIPAPLGYRGYPKSICTSVNHVVCHGIPSSDKKLFNGDIINIDVTVIVDGWHGDTSKTFFVGEPSIKAKRLIDVTYNAMMQAIEIVKPGLKLNEIGKCIQDYVENQGFSVVRDYCGHGIGKIFHDAPNVLHYFDPKDKRVLEEGMFFTIEPMINAGKYNVRLLKDGWTVVTADKSLSAQFEMSIGVVKDGAVIFT